MDRLAHELFRFRAEGEFDPPFRSEKIGHDRVTAVADAFEQKRWTTLRDDAPVYLRQFEIWVDFRFDDDKFILAAQKFKIRAKVAVHVC